MYFVSLQLYVFCIYCTYVHRRLSRCFAFGLFFFPHKNKVLESDTRAFYGRVVPSFRGATAERFWHRDDDDDGDDRSDDIGTSRDSIADRVAAVERRLSLKTTCSISSNLRAPSRDDVRGLLGTFALCLAGFRGVFR